jgi:hypothetical protein
MCEEGSGKREEGRGKREEGRGKMEAGRGKRKREDGKRWTCLQDVSLGGGQAVHSNTNNLGDDVVHVPLTINHDDLHQLGIVSALSLRRVLVRQYLGRVNLQKF